MLPISPKIGGGAKGGGLKLKTDMPVGKPKGGKAKVVGSMKKNPGKMKGGK